MPFGTGSLLDGLLHQGLAQHGVQHDGEALVSTGALVFAIALSTWHAIGLMCCAAARRWPERRSLVAATRWCPPLARGLAGAAVSAGIVLAPVAADASTTNPSDTTSESVPAPDAPFVRAPATPPPIAPSAPAVARAIPAPAPTLAPNPSAPRLHVVVAGDNLWRIAAAEVQRVSGVARPSDAATATYWRALIAANVSTLRSGDPSLIYPGEVVTLPAP
jgi:hypothetical protein